jgi:hypothetical protein
MSQIGLIGLVGNFDSITQHLYAGQSKAELILNGLSWLYANYPNGTFVSLA